MAAPLQTEILIPTPPAAVWRVLTDFPRYHEWNDFVRSVSGTPARHEKVTVALDVGLSELNRQQVTITEFIPPETLVWTNKFLFGGIVTTEHYFELYREGPAETLLLQGMRSSGLLPALINNPLEDVYLLRMREMNEALARVAVARYQGLV